MLVFATFLFLIVLSVSTRAHGTNNPSELLYVVGEDRKIYMLDFVSGETVSISDSLPELGSASTVDLDREKNILYIGSESPFRSRDTWFSIVGVDMDRNKVVSKILLTTTTRRGRVRNMTSSVYVLKWAEGRRQIYAGAGGHGNITINVHSGEVERKLDDYVLGPDDIISRDGGTTMYYRFDKKSEDSFGITVLAWNAFNGDTAEPFPYDDGLKSYYYTKSGTGEGIGVLYRISKSDGHVQGRYPILNPGEYVCEDRPLINSNETKATFRVGDTSGVKIRFLDLVTGDTKDIQMPGFSLSNLISSRVNRR